ncbi:hypothetical protein [Variovorax sp. OK605]|uniref:hypothetical protein n=1 Tax=Variovorax sp. OK605 TaxID=1855317 RepID=UPI00116066A8|nr:hypothetical protein [Variovorax sp. OK605]
MSLLKSLAATPLPRVEPDQALVDRLRLLEAAGHIRVLIPPPHVDCGSCMRQDTATVLEITPHGWAALRTGILDEKNALPIGPLTRGRASTALDVARLAVRFNGTRRRSGG